MDHVKTVKSGSKTLLSTYKVNNGNDALSITEILANGSKVEDYAGNAGNYDYGKISFSNVIIDTIQPQKPTISCFDNNKVLIDNNAVLIDDNASVSVTIKGEDKASISYSIDNGATWNVYNSITLSNNGVYKITAKQTDIAGNESSDSDVQTVTIDKGALIKKISATTFNGTYKAGDVINGYIEFRGSVTLSNFNITLNVKNGDTYKTISTFEGENNKYNFVYTVSDDDVLDGDYLNVSAISGDVTYKGQSKTISTLPVSNLEDNRKIKILTGKPEVKDSPSITGEDENVKLNITFDRVVSKGFGNIELAISKADFFIPTVLTESEYNDILVKIPTLEKYYKPGLNGATKNDDNTLTPDTTKKYILDFEINNDGSVPNTQSNAYSLKNLKELFISKGLNKVVIPMYSSAVSVTESSIIVDLTGEYKLPVKGAEYSITIPAGAVKDSVGNTNVEYAPEDKLLAPGVEKPEIRIQKNDYEIYWEEGVTKNTKNAKVRMPETASMKISCRTPDATIKYFANLKESDEVKVNDVVYHNTKTSDATVQEPTNSYEQNTEVTIGSEISTGYWKTKFDNAKGLKIAIAAQSQKNSATSHSYEYAARTVLKFEISSGDGYDDGQGNAETEIIENGKKLKIEDLQIWVTGGDSPSGGNSIEPFPMSWGDFSKFKLMKYDSGKESGKVRGKWYWITWDLSAPAYHGFVAGDVPSDAQNNGPKIYYAGECSWNPLKSYYILYPGETLRMQLASGHNDGGKAKYFFRLKNKVTR